MDLNVGSNFFMIGDGMNVSRQNIGGMFEREQGEIALVKYFYVAMALLLIVINLVGFGPTFYFNHYFNYPDLSQAFFIHGVVLSSWYVLFLVQSMLLEFKHYWLHRVLGYAGCVLALVILVSSVMMFFEFMVDFKPTSDVGALIYKATGLWAAIHLWFSFALFVVLGLVYRRMPGLHRRFMLLASIGMMTAPVARMSEFPGVPMHPGAFTFLVMFILLFLPMVHDKVMEGKVHKVSIAGASVYFITLIVFAAVMPFTEFGRELVYFFSG